MVNQATAFYLNDFPSDGSFHLSAKIVLTDDRDVFSPLSSFVKFAAVQVKSNLKAYNTDTMLAVEAVAFVLFFDFGHCFMQGIGRNVVLPVGSEKDH